MRTTHRSQESMSHFVSKIPTMFSSPVPAAVGRYGEEEGDGASKKEGGGGVKIKKNKKGCFISKR